MKRCINKRCSIISIILISILFIIINLTIISAQGSDLNISLAKQKLINYLNNQTCGGVEFSSYSDIGYLYEINVTYQGEIVTVYITKDGIYFVQGAIKINNSTKEVNGIIAGEKLVNYLNNKTGGGVVYDSSNDLGKIYEINVIYENQTIPVFITKDSQYFIQGAILINDTNSSGCYNNLNNSNISIPKSDKPDVELFVMTLCPYGSQEEKGIIPVFDLLGEKINTKIRFVHYFMHGDEEELQTYVQICIREEQSKKYIDYLSCFLQKGNSPNCLEKNNINMNLLNICLSDNYKKAKEYYEVDKNLSLGYEVYGCPALVINGKIIDTSRSSAELLNTICSAFNNAPEECLTNLSTKIPSPGFSDININYLSPSDKSSVNGEVEFIINYTSKENKFVFFSLLSLDLNKILISGENASLILTNYLNSKNKGNTSYLSYRDIGDLYEVNVSNNNQIIPFYITKDGMYFLENITQTNNFSNESNTTERELVKNLRIWNQYGIISGKSLGYLIEYKLNSSVFNNSMFITQEGRYMVNGNVEKINLKKYYHFNTGDYLNSPNLQVLLVSIKECSSNNICSFKVNLSEYAPATMGYYFGIIGDYEYQFSNPYQIEVGKVSCDNNNDCFNKGFIKNFSKNSNLSNIKVNISNNIIYIGKDNQTRVIFQQDFKRNILNLENLTIKNQDNLSSYSYLIINGLDLSRFGTKKIIYLDRILNSTGICIKDKEIFSITEISDNCKDQNEFWVPCPGSTGQYFCNLSLDNNKYIVRGLNHSGVKEQSIYCGDNVCNSEESCSTCSNDCGGCPQPPSGGGGGGGGGSSTTETQKKNNTISNFSNASKSSNQNLVLNNTELTNEINKTLNKPSNENKGLFGITGRYINVNLIKRSLPYSIIVLIIIIIILFYIFYYQKNKGSNNKIRFYMKKKNKIKKR